MERTNGNAVVQTFVSVGLIDHLFLPKVICSTLNYYCMMIKQAVFDWTVKRFRALYCLGIEHKSRQSKIDLAISVKRRCVKVDGHETTPTQCLTLLLYRSACMDGSGVAAKRTGEFAERLPACLLGYLSAFQSIDHLSSICAYILQRFLHFACNVTAINVSLSNEETVFTFELGLT
ncbi:hypothetical protein T01_2049 [Trichinella spiralis]|uniref:Uncharacterized protein n=1 Tax=Trichinella spiralis TaxID=6334 RepID=A0A0V1APL5_TRISP|nr:hypothetical protein T01_2049 [Trichinella spiralis]